MFLENVQYEEKSEMLLNLYMQYKVKVTVCQGMYDCMSNNPQQKRLNTNLNTFWKSKQ